MKNPKPTTQTVLKNEAKKLFATVGYEGFSIRLLAEKSGVGISSIYHFFKEKDDILFEVFEEVSIELGRQRALLPHRRSASMMLKDRIRFQFEHIEEVVFVLKYYLHFRENFDKQKTGYIPAKAYLHIEEVLAQGCKSGTFTIRERDITKESKVIAHAINGFLLEYYPVVPKRKELNAIVDSIYMFLLRSLTNEKEVKV